MNEPAPRTTGLQIALILAFMLATILAVTTYQLYRENQELKQQLEQQNPAQASLVNSPAWGLVSLREHDHCGSVNPGAFLLVPGVERYNRI
jgi:hypothetical protein